MRHFKTSFHTRLCLLVVIAGLGLADSVYTQTSIRSTKAVELRGPWKLGIDADRRGVAERWFAPDHDRGGWITVQVPGPWDAAGLDKYDGIGWYATTFDFTPVKRLRHALVFDAVDDNAEIWLNGACVGVHNGYGQKFHFDITSMLHKGRNSLVVCIEDLAGPGGIIGAVHIQPYVSDVELLKSRYHDMKPVASPQWVKDAIVYEAYLRSFSKEGTFKALEARLPELKSLGATVVWLMPIHPVGALHRKGTLGSPYSVQDFRAVNPEFGTMDDFRALVKAAHREGLHIIIDLVANHTAWDNPLITEHPDWYTKNAKGEIVAPNPDWTDVADLDYSQPGLRAWMTETMAWWVRDVGIDGFRCDVAEMAPTEFWREARKALDAIKPVMMLAEGSLPAEHIGAFDMTYAWNTYDVLEPIMRGKLAPATLDAVLKSEYYAFPKGALRLRFSSNHDKNMYDDPAVTRYTPAGAAAAAVLMYTLPGVPLIYNGDEAGSPVKLQLFEKTPIQWAPDSMRFRELYTVLNRLRATLPALRSGDWTPLPAVKGNDTLVCAFTRGLGKARVYVLINLSQNPQRYTLDIGSANGLKHHLMKCAIRTGTAYIEFRLPPYGYWVGSN